MIEVNGKRFKIRFKHSLYPAVGYDEDGDVFSIPPVLIELPLSGKFREVIGDTLCFIEKHTGFDILCEDGIERPEYTKFKTGLTYCSSLDAPYKKYRGKKEALAHTLWEDEKVTREDDGVEIGVSRFTVEERTAIWDWFKLECGIEERQPSTINRAELARRKNKQ